MKSKQNTCDNQFLLQLIDRYFEAQTSLEEERELRRLLAVTDCDDEAVEAARAVMGVFAVDRKFINEKAQEVRRRSLRRPTPSHWVAISAVASIAIIVVAVVALMKVTPMSQPQVLSVASLGSGHDSIAQVVPDNRNYAETRRSVASSQSMKVNKPENPDEIDALIKSEMGMMAEAQGALYESVASDFAAISSIMDK